MAEPSTSRGKLRAGAAAVLGVLTVLVLLVATVAVWASVTVFDSERFAGIVDDALADPDVQAALADHVTDQVFASVDIDAAVSDVVPAQLERLEPVLSAGIRTFVERSVSRALANPEVQDLMTTVVERAHGRAMDLLQGDGLVDGITVVDGAVTVNLLPLLERALTEVQSLGLFPNFEVPEMTADGDPAEQIAALSEATGRDLPDDFGQLVVYESDKLADAQASLQTAQNVLATAKRAVVLLVVLAVVLVVATILVARHRWRATLLLGLGAAGAMVVARSAVRRVVDDAPALAANPGGKATVSAILESASEGLLRLAGLLLVIAAAAVVVALFRRRWNRDDLYLVAAVVAGLAVVAVLEVSIVSLLVGLVLAIAVAVLAPRLVERPASPQPA